MPPDHRYTRPVIGIGFPKSVYHSKSRSRKMVARAGLTRPPYCFNQHAAAPRGSLSFLIVLLFYQSGNDVEGSRQTCTAMPRYLAGVNPSIKAMASAFGLPGFSLLR